MAFVFNLHAIQHVANHYLMPAAGLDGEVVFKTANTLVFSKSQHVLINQDTVDDINAKGIEDHEVARDLARRIRAEKLEQSGGEFNMKALIDRIDDLEASIECLQEKIDALPI